MKLIFFSLVLLLTLTRIQTKPPTITQKPTIVFGGIREDFVHANGVEEFLIGRSMSDHEMFEEVGSLTISTKNT